MNIRYQLRLFFSLTLLLFLSMNLYGTYLHNKNAKQNNLLRNKLQQTLLQSHSVELHLQAERTAWKNVLLRGTEIGKYHQYLSNYYKEERNTRKEIRNMQAEFKGEDDIYSLLLNLDAAHHALGRTLRKAINQFNATADNPHLVADTIAIEMESDPDLMIKQLSKLIKQHHTEQLALIASAAKNKENTLFILFIVIGIFSAIIFVWMIDRQVGKPAEEAAYLASYDSLTGLPNRALLLDRLHHAMERAARDNSKLALLFFDLDRFKAVNDVLGHNVGDELLKQVAERLKNNIRKSDTPARLGGDEFAVILEGSVDAAEVINVVNHLHDSLQSPFDVIGHRSHISASVGITFFPDDGDTSDILLKNADTAMYQAKAKGRNTYHFFTADLNSVAETRLQMENLLRTAVENKQFSIHYQPQVVLKNDRIIGAEALLRLKTDERMIPPDEFIPILEDTGLIMEVGEWVLKQACMKASEWLSLNSGEFRIAVNLSARQLSSPFLIEHVQQALADSHLPPNCLELEITEHNLIDVYTSNDILQNIEALGVRIAIDDFGTGYSSLSYLKMLSVDVLKIDRSFIRDINKDQDDDAITSAIVALAQRLGIEVVAEGVENEEQLAFLRGVDCQYIQGYLVSRPIAPEDFHQWMIRTQSGDKRPNWLPAT